MRHSQPGNRDAIMDFLNSVLGSSGAITAGIACLVGLVILVFAAVLIGVVIWQVRKGKLRVVTGERNFDDFGR